MYMQGSHFTASGQSTCSRRLPRLILRGLVATGLGATASGVNAQRLYGEMFGPPARQQTVTSDFTVHGFDSSEVDEAKEKFNFTATEFLLSYRVPTKSRGEWQAGTKVAYYGVDTEARLPVSGAAIPEDLWDVELYGGYRRQLEHRRMVGLFLRASSPSDTPFHTVDETVIDVTGLYQIPSGERNSWNFFLSYANQRSFLANIPLPGVGFAYVPNRQTFALIGLPVTMFRTRYGLNWGLEFFYFPPIRGKAMLSYDIAPNLTPYLGIKSYRDAFLRSDREDTDAWLRHAVVLGELGLTWKLNRRIKMDASAGYAVDRYVYESDSFTDDDDRIDLESGSAFRIQLTAAM